MVQQPIREFTEYESADGVVYSLTVPSRYGRWVVTQTGWGTPPIEHVTQRGPLQHGETVRDSYLRPRIIQMLIRQDFCNRDDYWSGRGALINAIRPNRQSTAGGIEPGLLTRLLSDGTRRRLDVYPQSGPAFEPSQARVWDEHSFSEILRWLALDPVIYDPTRVDTTLTVGGTTVLSYAGTWASFPDILITGPITNPSITNDTLGHKIELTHTVAAGVVLTISLSPSVKTVIDDLGVSHIDKLTTDSNIAAWCLHPAPEAANGANSLTTAGSGTTGATAFEVRAFSRYFGI